MSEQRRISFIPYNSKDVNYSKENHRIGELSIDRDTGMAEFKTGSGEIIQLKGQGYTDLLAYIKSSVGVGSNITDTQSLQIDTSLATTPSNAVVGVLKIKTTDESGNVIMRPVSLISDSKGINIMMEDGKPISLQSFYEIMTSFKGKTEETLKDHESRMVEVETVLKNSALDIPIHYSTFSEEESMNLTYCIGINEIANDVIVRNLLEVTTTLAMDSGLSSNRHQILLTIDGINRKVTAVVNSIGSAVDLGVEFYLKNNKVYVRPTQIDGEFLIRDKSPNLGTYVKFNGAITIEEFDSLNLATTDLLDVTGGGGGSGAATYKVTQEDHGFPSMCTITFKDGIWKLASLDEQAKAIAISNSKDVFTVITGGHVAIPVDALDDEGDAFIDGEFYVMSETVHGGISKLEPKMVYQDIGYCYSKGGVLMFVVDIETPVDLASEAVADLATKGELAQRQLVVQSEGEIRQLSLPIGTFITVNAGVDTHYRRVEAEGTAGTITTLNGKFANIVDTNKYIEDLKVIINEKLDKGSSTLDDRYNTALKIITKMLDLDTKKLEKGTFNGDTDSLIAMIEERLLISKACNDFTSGGTDTYATGELIKQLYLIVKTIQEGGSLRSLLKVEKLGAIRSEKILYKGNKVITSDKGFFFDPALFIEGQFVHPATYVIDRAGGIITLNDVYSTGRDVAYEVVDEYPTDIKFVADTALYVTGSVIKDDLELKDVIKILGDSEAYDGGQHLRRVESTKGLNGLDLENGLWLNEVPFSRVKAVYTELKEDVQSVAGGMIGYNDIEYIQSAGTKVAGYMYKDIALKKLYLCTQDTSTTVFNDTYFTDISNLNLSNKLDNLRNDSYGSVSMQSLELSTFKDVIKYLISVAPDSYKKLYYVDGTKLSDIPEELKLSRFEFTIFHMSNNYGVKGMVQTATVCYIIYSWNMVNNIVWTKL